jgi:lipid II:glycine glycyltransferase (peptidoglycan interpeptide bridge formation enzyme)
MSEVSFAEWQSFLKKQSDVHLLQTGEWGELKSAFGWKPVRLVLDDKNGAQILFRRLPFGLTLGYMPKPVFSDRLSAISDQCWNEVDFICKKYHAVFLKIEPDVWDSNFILHRSSFILGKHNIQPPRTFVLNIKDTEDVILARMKQKCRYNIRLAEKKAVTVRAWDDIEGFYAMIQVTGGRDGFGVHSHDYYRRAYELFYPTGTCELLVAEFEGKPLAALMVFAHGRRAWYVYGASNDEERNRMPTYLLQWEAIRWAKARGCEEYDLWGVPDESEDVLEANFESRHDGLWGVYRFKRGFGGELKRAAQAYDRVYNPLLYKFYLWRMAGREGG